MVTSSKSEALTKMPSVMFNRWVTARVLPEADTFSEAWVLVMVRL